MMCSKTILYTVLCASVAQIVTASIQKIGPYTPITEVSDRGALSNDQRIILELLKNPTQSQFQAAKRVYEEGGSSGPIATIFVPGGVPLALKGSKDEVTADSIDGRVMSSAIVEDVPAGGTTVKLRYYGTGNFDAPHLCIVGGLPRNERITDGCYNATGTMKFDTGFGAPTVTFAYEYDVLKNNTNKRSIQGFSSNADTLMRVGGIDGNPFYDSFQPFVDYYGRADYADHIIQSAIVNNDTDLLNGNFNMKTAGYDQKAAAQVFFKATAYVIMSMAILYEVETAVYQCDSSCDIGDCNEDPNIFSLDEAVAYFRGQHDVLMAQLNQLRCANFGTCSDLPTLGDATANDNIFKFFGEMQTYLNVADCEKARGVIPKIASQLWLGLLQGTLRYAWITDGAGHNPAPRPTATAQAEGAIFAAGILPLIDKCNQASAKTIYDNLSPSERVGCDFVAVKKAFESCYKDLGIDCAEVGGLIGGTGSYEVCATIPCGGTVAVKLDVPEGCSVTDVEDPGLGTISAATSLSLRGGFLVFSGLIVIATSIGVFM